MKTITTFLFVIIVGVFWGCSDKKESLIVYTTVDQIFSEPILKKFELKTGINVKAIYDTEETKSTGILNRLLAEKDNPQCDVFWSGDPVRNIILKKKNILSAYNSNAANGIPEIYKDKKHFWTGFSSRARVLIYNKRFLKEEDIPLSIFDLTEEKYKGQVSIANPLFGTTTFHMAALFSVLGNEKAEQFLTKLKDNEVVIATSNGDVKRRVMKGEVFCGITDTDDAFEAVKEQKNIGIVFLDQHGIGSLIMPNTVCLIKKEFENKNAKILIDFLLSKETESDLAFSCMQMPLHKSVKIPNDIPSLDKIKSMNINYELTAKKLEEIQNYLKKWVEK